MHALVKLLAPKGRMDWMVKAVSFLMLILALKLLVEQVLLGRPSMSFGKAALSTAIIGGPFIVLSLSVVGYLDRLQKQMNALARTDALTGLPNRRSFMDTLEARVQQGARGVLFLFDADHFKLLNDRYGHPTGDACLQAVAVRLADHATSADCVSRFGGEEFALFLDGVSRTEAELIGPRVCAEITVSNRGGPDVKFTLSGGAVETHPGFTVGDLLSAADRALYAAKAAGRAQVKFWDPPRIEAKRLLN